jgi:hypothetical protein
MNSKLFCLFCLTISCSYFNVQAACSVGTNNECQAQVCGRFRRNRPMPTIYNACMTGCRAAINAKQNVNCHGICGSQPTPRPTTTNACQAGCFAMRDMFRSCPADIPEPAAPKAETVKEEVVLDNAEQKAKAEAAAATAEEKRRLDAEKAAEEESTKTVEKMRQEELRREAEALAEATAAAEATKEESEKKAAAEAKAKVDANKSAEEEATKEAEKIAATEA